MFFETVRMGNMEELPMLGFQVGTKIFLAVMDSLLKPRL
jgi:hypothetical protein